MNENLISVSGNVIAEPEMRQTKGGPMLTFRVASNHRYFNNRSGQWEEGVTNYYDIVAFRQLALNSAASLHKGYAVLVQGQLRQRRFTRQDGSQGMSCEIAARVVGPDLTHGIAQWMRRPKAQQPGGGPVQGDGTAQRATESEDSGALPDPEHTDYVVARDHEPEESYRAPRVDADGVVLDEAEDDGEGAPDPVDGAAA
jgi:single-strand DNA-binding protein